MLSQLGKLEYTIQAHLHLQLQSTQDIDTNLCKRGYLMLKKPLPVSVKMFIHKKNRRTFYKCCDF